jgi:hypothetical protein
MDAPSLTRRDFITTLGGIVLSFSLGPKVALGQEPARLPGSLQTNRTLDAWLRINCRRQRHRVHRQGRARDRAS